MDSERNPNHVSPDELLDRGQQALELIAEYLKQVEKYPVLSQLNPGDVYNQLPQHPPIQGEPFQDVLEDIKKYIIPGLTHWQSPNFFAYFPANSSGPGIVGDILSSGFGIQGMLWSTSPACTELETLVTDWMVDIAGLPPRFRSNSTGGGVIQDTASMATLCAVVAGREQALRKSGKSLPMLTAYISEHTHSSAEKGLKIAGFTQDKIRQVEVDDDCRMIPEKLHLLIASDLKKGLVPAFVCTTIGTTSSLAVDPVRAIGEITNAHDIWLHVDGALAGCATVCPEYRWLVDGLELASSYCFNPHKWLLTNFDCDLFYVAERNALVDALTFTPEFLKNKHTESGKVFDYSGWQVSLGRRFRSLKLWLVIRHYGIEGLQAHIRKHCRLAKEFASWVESDDDFVLLQPSTLNLVCFHHQDGNDVTRKILETLNASGKIFVTHTVLDNTYVIRFAVGSLQTERSHIENAWAAIKEAARTIR